MTLWQLYKNIKNKEKGNDSAYLEGDIPLRVTSLHQVFRKGI